MTAGERVRAVLRWAMALGIPGILGGCSGGPTASTVPVETGGAEIVALVSAAAGMTRVTASVEGPARSQPWVFPLVRNGNRWRGSLAELPAGPGYTFKLAGDDASGAALQPESLGPVSILGGKTVGIVIGVQPRPLPRPPRNLAPVIQSLFVSPTLVAPGGTVLLRATLGDPNPEDATSQAWSATGGAVADGAGGASVAGGTEMSSASVLATATWTAPMTAGTETLTFTAVDSQRATATAVVTLEVRAEGDQSATEMTAGMNSWPVITQLVAGPRWVSVGASTDLLVDAADADHDSMTYSWTSSCAGTFSDPAGIAPAFMLSSESTETVCALSVAAADGREGTAQQKLELPVERVHPDRMLTLMSRSQSSLLVGPDEPVMLVAEFAHAGSSPLTFLWSATGGSIDGQQDGADGTQVHWTPPATLADSWQITVIASSNSGQTALETFTVRPRSCWVGAVPPSSIWSFGVMADTQWVGLDDGKNPNSVAADIIGQVNQEFIAKGVKFVVQLGDLSDSGSPLGCDTRAAYAQALYDAGIGFYPVRGNHDGSLATGLEVQRVFPQTQNGLNNATPQEALDSLAVTSSAPLVPKTGYAFTVGQSFSSPADNLRGLSYSFDYQNLRLVLLDQYTPTDGAANTIAAQQPWVERLLATRLPDSHALVFAHTGLVNQVHTDHLFGSTPSEAPAEQDAFITLLAAQGVRYLFHGHDHMHHRALVSTTDGHSARVEDILCAGASSKFYVPFSPGNDSWYNVPAFGVSRETPLSQELFTVGYYLVTVDGPRVTVDYYSAPMDPTLTTTGGFVTTPPLGFSKRETFGYALNGREFVVHRGQSYALVQDDFSVTGARVLGGVNASRATDRSGRALAHAVDTGWTTRTCAVNSDVLTLWGMASELGSEQTDVYTLSVNYQFEPPGPSPLADGLFGLASRDPSGLWINAVDRNLGGSQRFIAGAWDPSYPLGSYGIDSTTQTAWAVVNYDGDFVVTRFAPAP